MTTQDATSAAVPSPLLPSAPSPFQPGGPEQVVFCHDEPTGLRAIIAIHSTALGPALGGTRFHPYATEADALADVLNLARGMAYKNALAGLDLGGGKAVIIGDPHKIRSEALLRSYARFVDSLGGRRSGLRHESYRTLVTQFLSELDGAGGQSEGVLVIGATNAPWDVDEAMLLAEVRRNAGLIVRGCAAVKAGRLPEFAPRFDLDAADPVNLRFLECRPADALDVYSELARALRNELGLDPGTQLQRLHQLILLREPIPIDSTFELLQLDKTA